MTQCIDPDIGKLLHAFELGQTDENERERFEEHLLRCDACFEAVAAFEPAAELLRGDTEVRELAAQGAREVTSKTDWLTSLKEAIWPTERPVLLRPAVAYLALVLLAIPAYQGLKTDVRPAGHSPQTILLTSTRSAGSAQAGTDRGVALVFRAPDAQQGDTLIISVTDEAGDVRFVDSSFTGLIEGRLGTVIFEAGTLEPGAYQLEVTDKSLFSATRFRFDIR